MCVCNFFLLKLPHLRHCQLLAKLEGKEAAKAALRTAAAGGRDDSASSVSVADAVAANPRYMQQEDEDETTREQSLTKDALRLRQLQLQGTCAKLILACVRHRCVVRFSPEYACAA